MLRRVSAEVGMGLSDSNAVKHCNNQQHDILNMFDTRRTKQDLPRHNLSKRKDMGTRQMKSNWSSLLNASCAAACTCGMGHKYMVCTDTQQARLPVRKSCAPIMQVKSGRCSLGSVRCRSGEQCAAEKVHRQKIGMVPCRSTAEEISNSLACVMAARETPQRAYSQQKAQSRFPASCLPPCGTVSFGPATHLGSGPSSHRRYPSSCRLR